METTRTCPQCQQPLSADAPDGLCPQCLMRAASGPPPSAAGEGLLGDIIDIGDPAEVAKKLPQFEILEMLGRGGMGVVYKARQLQLDRLVAVKILPPVDALTPDFVARFTREARALAKLNHPNIVNVYDFGETGGLYYIVMEYVDGANLRQLLEARKLTPAEALAIVPKICDALEYAHEEGLVHRDIKPENLLIDKKGRVKIADFGLAKLLRREPLDMTLTLSGMALGTLRYMAPEQMDKPETVDHRADLYSLGVVIYEMLTGETPVGRFELPSQKAQVDVRFDEIVMHALEREPARRYQHASEVRDDVEKVTSKPQVAPVTSTPPPVSPPASAPATSERSSFLAFLRLLLWLILVICAAVFLVFDTTPTAADRAAFLHDTVHIGAVQPWLHYGEESYNHTRFSVSFLTLSAGAGLCAVVVALALFSTRRRNLPDVRREVRRAAVGLLVSGVAGAIMTFAFTMMLINEGQWDKRLIGCIVGVALDVTFAVLATFVFRGALKMLHGEDYAASRRAALCSIFSFNIVSLPIGIWALVKLSKPEVKALFAEPAETSRPPSPVEPKRTRHLLSAALTLLCLFALFFGLSFQAKTGATAAGQTRIITVGALDPLFFSESGPSGFHTGFDFFSWSFLAVVVAGIAFSAMWRIGREDQGKVTRDPAWWRDWWKQVGVWGGLLLIACIVRTVRHPEKVLQPPGERTVPSQFTKLLDLTPEPAIRIDRSQIPSVTTPGHTYYGYTFSAPANYRLKVWFEFWKDGKMTIDPEFSRGFAEARGKRMQASLQITFIDGLVASPATAGQTRIDWHLPGATFGRWLPDPFKGAKIYTTPAGLVEKWNAPAGETVTLFMLTGTARDSMPAGMTTEEQLRAGYPEMGLVLKARFDPVDPARLREGVVPQNQSAVEMPGTHEPAPSLLRLAERFGETLEAFVSAEEIRAMLASRFQKSAEDRAKAEQMLREMGVTFSPDEKPLELVKKLEEVTTEIGK